MSGKSEHQLDLRLILACKDGKINLAKKCVEDGANPSFSDSNALYVAALNGRKDIVEFLIPISDPKAENSRALRYAAAKGHDDIVRALIPVSEPKASNSLALTRAVEGGHETVAMTLLPYSEPKDGKSAALQAAAKKRDARMMSILIPLSDPEIAIRELAKKDKEASVYLEAEMQKKSMMDKYGTAIAITGRTKNETV